MEQNIINDIDIRLISVREACKRLGIGNWAIYQQISKKALKTVKIGKRRLVSLNALNEFISSLEQQ
jgi:excisionase family DNA binding protein